MEKPFVVTPESYRSLSVLPIHNRDEKEERSLCELRGEKLHSIRTDATGFRESLLSRSYGLSGISMLSIRIVQFTRVGLHFLFISLTISHIFCSNLHTSYIHCCVFRLHFYRK